jgi:DNA-binding GntR family transcriptional regulator
MTEAVELAGFYNEKNDIEHIKELDTVFHSIIFKASGSRFLSRTLTELHRKIKSYRKRSLSVPGRVQKSADEHREILEAIKAGDSDKADSLTSLHVRRAFENMLCVIAE